MNIPANCTTVTFQIFSVRGQMKAVTVSVVHQRRMKIRWHLNCLDRAGKITGYKISYCAIGSSNRHDNCTGSMIDVEADSAADELWIENLEPWIYYKIAIAMVSHHMVNDLSEFTVERTRAAKPSTPVRNLRAKLHDRATVQLMWDDPLKPNGEIAGFEVTYDYIDHMDKAIRKRLLIQDNINTEKITGLEFNSLYTFSVRPCVNLSISEELACGDFEASTSIQTGVGVSGAMYSPEVVFVNSSQIVVSWPDRFHAGGPIHQYDIKIFNQALEESHIVKVKSATSIMNKRKELSLDHLGDQLNWAPDCKNESVHSNLFNFSIRAITIDHNGSTFVGPWSKEKVIPDACYGKHALKNNLCNHEASASKNLNLGAYANFHNSFSYFINWKLIFQPIHK